MPAIWKAGRCRRIWANGFALISAAVCTGAVMAEGGIVSIDFCADQFVLAVAEKPAIQAVSYEATGPQSYFADRAAEMQTVDGRLEELLMLQPDQVVRTWRGGKRMGELLEYAGIKSYQPPYAFGIEGTLETFGLVGEQLGYAQVASKYVAVQKQQLSILAGLPRSGARAVYMTPSGFTAGTGTYIDDIIKLAGFETIAEEAGISFWLPLPLEKLVLSPPDFVVAAYFHDSDVHVSNWSSGRHGVYKKLMGNLPTIHVPSHLLACSGAFAPEAAKYIRTEAGKLGLLDWEANNE